MTILESFTQSFNYCLNLDINNHLLDLQDLFEDDYVEDIEYDQGDSTDWFQAEIFRIHGCKTLRLSLKSGRDTLADYFSEKLLIVEQIESLELEDFEVGELPGSNNFGTVSFDTSKYLASNRGISIQGEVRHV